MDYFSHHQYINDALVSNYSQRYKQFINSGPYMHLYVFTKLVQLLYLYTNILPYMN